MENYKIKEIIQEFIIGNYKYSVKKSLMQKDKKNRYIYNEISLQHELGMYLRKNLKDEYIVQFERNIKDFGYKKGEFCKSEIDIVLLGKEKDDNILIELKYHTLDETRYHDTTADCVKDIRFVYDVVNDYEKNIEDTENYIIFKKGFCLTIVEDKKFYTKSNREKFFNYYCFRDINNKFDGKISYSGKDKNKTVKDTETLIDEGYLPIRENHQNEKNTGWIPIYDEAKYYLIEI